MAQRVQTDWWLFTAILGLLAIGLTMVFSSSSVVAEIRYGSGFHFAVRQAMWAAPSIFIMMYLKRRDFRRWESPRLAYLSVALLLPALIAVYALDPKNHRWIPLGPANLQPSEFAKPVLVLFLAYFVARRSSELNSKYTLMPAAAIIGLITGAVLIPDVGTALVLAAAAAVVFFVAGLEWRYVLVAGIVLAVFLAVAIVQKPYRIARVFGFYDPEYKAADSSLVRRFDPEGRLKAWLERMAPTRDARYHINQSLIAVGSGGLLGRGLGRGRQKLFYLPEAHTDFIFAVIAEELGMWGAAMVVGCFLIILWRGLRIHFRAPDPFARHLALAVTTIVVSQALLNVSVVLGMVPTKGIPLPLVSYGGSSLLSTMILLGMLQSVGEHTA